MAASVSHLTTLSLFSPRTPNPFSPKPKPTMPRTRPPPISIYMDPSFVDPAHLQALMLACGHSCLCLSRPAATSSEPVDLRKLRTALAHSFLVVSVFCGARFLDAGEQESFPGVGLVFVPEAERRLVGFGRVVSDVGLTASVHDVVVHPALQRRGIGRKIVERITRVLHSRGIYDISALCTEKERPFFQACGFGEDALGSTTMMYTRNMPR